MSQVKDLEEFLILAELQDYYTNFKDLKVNNIPQLKYVEEEDLIDMGMTKPEIRRFKKFFRKECPQGTFSKLKKKLLTVSTNTQETNGRSSPPTPGPERSPLSKTSGSKTIIPEESISLLKLLGTGEFGTVQQGCWTNEENKKIQVAIKCLSREKMQTGMPDFLKEATIMQTIDHDHIVRLFGVVLGQEALMLVTELAPMRSLLECLKDPLMRSTFPVLRLCEFAIQVCDGMSYLENKRFIHRDLAARNILVYSKDKVKISDFGLSRALGVGKDYYQTNFNINLKLPIAWCAPECINYLRFTSSSDVWAFGVTLWEMFTYGLQPWVGLTGQQILDNIDEPTCQRLEQPECCPRDMYDVMLKCWEHEPESRPKFTELLLMLPQIKPECVQAKKDGPLITDDKDFLTFKQNDIITVLDKRPEETPGEDMWKGILDNGRTGYFRTEDAAPYIEIKCVASPILRNKPKITRKESSRKSSRSSKKFDISMISGPQDDLRHTGHIGYDGAVFGDVSFIGSQYNRLPVKVGPTGINTATNGLMTASAMSLSRSEFDGSDNHLVTQSHSEACILDKFPVNNISDDVFTVSGINQNSGQSEVDNVTSSAEKYEDIDDDFGGFSMPSFSVGSSLDLGGSLMDEVMKVWTVAEPSTTNGNSNDTVQDSKDTAKSTTPVNNTIPNTDTLSDDKSPLLEKDPSFSSEGGSGMTASFDNIAMTNDSDSMYTNEREGSTTPELSNSQEFVINNSETELPVMQSEKKRKPKLKIQPDSEESDDEYIPGRGRQKGIRTLSESEERQMDEAIELANSYAAKGTADHMVSTPSPKSFESLSDRSHGDSDGNSSVSSPKGRSVFNLRKKSPKQERKTFTDEIAGISDASEDITVEAQEAYNMLIVKGSIKESKNKDSISDRSTGSREIRKMPHRIRDHTTLSSESNGNEKPVVAPRANRNIRAPQGIPGRSVSVDQEVTDSNPLRRLRESVVIPPKTKPRPAGHQSTDSTDKINGKAENAKKPILSANLPFFDKLKEQELSQDSGEGSEEGINPVPLPPRVKSKSNNNKTSTNTKPRQRKYPLDLSKYKDTASDTNHILNQNQHIYTNKSSPSSSSPPDRNTPDREVINSDFLNVSRDSDDSVFSSCSPNSSLERTVGVSSSSSSSIKQDNDQQALDSPFSVKSVKLTARDLGYQDTTDLFWAKPVNLEDFGSIHAPIPGRYKTSDTVSYEDLLEFALDGVSERESEQDICDEVRLMRKILTKDVTIEDCMYCLEETSWDINSAIKLVKLKQVLSTNLADKDKCKEVLMKCNWDVQEAANYLIQHPPGQESPELVHV